MDCKEIRSKLKAYMDGNVTDDENDSLSEHLAECPECMKELEKLENNSKQERKGSNKLYKKAEKKLRRSVALIALITFTVLFASYAVLNWLLPVAGSIYYSSMPDFSRALADVVQFSQPNNVGGFGNSFDRGIHFYTRLKSYTHDKAGKKGIPKQAIEAKLYLFSNGIENPVGIMVNFIHPDNNLRNESAAAGTVDKVKRILVKNGENTVSTISVSLRETISIKDIKVILDSYDVDILWMAAECGQEAAEARNMAYDFIQYVQWGVPGSLFSPYSFDRPMILEKSNVDVFFNKVTQEMKWLNDNKEIIKPNKMILSANGIDNSIGDKARYIMENGYIIYGLKVTGPTEEIIRLYDALDIRYAELNHIDFWNWE
ncbi:MAG: anti sigma factor C-terminal domain-containing protein [Bacillota bacterium]